MVPSYIGANLLASSYGAQLRASTKVHNGRLVVKLMRSTPSGLRKDSHSSWLSGGGRGAFRADEVALSRRSRSRSSKTPTLVAASPLLSRSPSAPAASRAASLDSHSAPGDASGTPAAPSARNAHQIQVW